MQMPTLKLKFFIIGFLVFNLISCGGGSGFSRVDTGNVVQCPSSESYEPISDIIEKESNVSKVSWPQSSSSDPAMEPGTYRYINMEFYFVDTETQFQYHVKESPIVVEDKIAEEAHQVSAVCVRNALNMKEMSLEFQFPAEVTVSENGKIESKVRTLAMSLNRQSPLVGTVSEFEAKATPPTKVVGDQNFSSQVYKIVQTNDTVVYQMQIVDKSGAIQKWAKVDFLKK